MKTFTILLSVFFLSQVHAIVPTDAFTFGFNIRTHDMNIHQEEKISQSVELLRTVFSGPEFRKRILQHRYKGRKAYAHNKGLTNEQIYLKIMDGMEKLEKEKNNAMDVEIALFTDMESRVLGFTRTLTKKIWMNTKYFNEKTSPVETSAHLMHEWLHKLGFGHEKKRCENRKYSVPYAIGYIVKELAEEAYLPTVDDSKRSFLDHWQVNNPQKMNSRL